MGQALASRGVRAEMVIVSTAGDRRAADTPWGEGAFVRAIEQAVLDGFADVAVHSAKDVPTEEDPRLWIGGYLPRAEARDALVLANGRVGSLDDLAPGSVVGTDSPRRRGFLLARRPDLQVRAIHGNVDSRVRRLDAGEVDALVLAAAGLIRLNLEHRISQLLPTEVMPPAAGQGALAVQVRSDDNAARSVVASFDDPPTRRAVETERAALAATGGGCRAPIGVLAEVSGDRLTVTCGFATLDGRATGIEAVSGSTNEATPLAHELARRIVERRSREATDRRVIVTRPVSDSSVIATRLAELGVQPVIVPAIEIDLLDQSAAVTDALRQLAGYDWAVATSANGARTVALCASHNGLPLTVTRWAAVGRRTQRELEEAGVGGVWIPAQSNATSLAAGLPVEPGQRVVWFAGSLADDSLVGDLEARGAIVTRVLAYVTREAPAPSAALLRGALVDGFANAVVFASELAVRGFMALAREQGLDAEALRLPAVCVGPRTAATAAQAGFFVADIAHNQDATVLAELAALAASR